jgi:hypothetical protein
MTAGCSVAGCGHRAPHAGRHGEPCRPASTYCAPARCYCGACPSWRPRIAPAPPPVELARVETILAPVRERLRAELTPAQRRAVAERRRDQLGRLGLTVASTSRLAA